MSRKVLDIEEKLKGAANYHTWCFAAINVLTFNGYEKCIHEDETKRETNADKLKNAKALLSLSVESSLYIHIQKCETAYDIWKKLKDLFDDKGLTRKIGLLKSLIQSKLDDFPCMQDYLDHIVNCSNKLSGIGFEISDEWSVAITLAGLNEKFSPLIMSIESNEKTMTCSTLISKLLDHQEAGPSSGEALMSKNKSKNSNKSKFQRKKCETCGKKHKGICNKKQNNEHTAKNAFSAFKCEAATDKNAWYVDSGASAHMTPNVEILSDLKTTSADCITAANGDGMCVKGVGSALLNISEKEIIANNVLHVPKLTVNLLSVSRIVENGNTVTFKKSGCTIKNANDEIIAQCNAQNGVYKMLVGKNNNCLLTNKAESAYTWHRRLGHVNFDTLKKMKNGAVEGINFNDNDDEIRNCETCARGKLARLPFNKSRSESKEILNLIHTDLVGPMEVESIGRAKYLITFVDDFSRMVFVYFTRTKSNTFETFKNFRAMIEKQTDRKMKILRSDNGGEYESIEFCNYLKANGIIHQTSAAHTPQQNGRAERMNRTIIEKAKCLLFDAGLPKCYWAEAVSMAAYLINRTYSSTHGSTPFEKFTNQKVNIADLKLFGCPVMVHVPKANRRKLDEKATKMIFVGYDSETKGFRCINTTNRKLTISRDVKFLDHSKQPAQKYLDHYEISDSEDDDGNCTPDEFNTPNTSSTPINVTSINVPSINVSPQSNDLNTAGASVNASNNSINANNNENDGKSVNQDDSHGEGDDTLVDAGEKTTSKNDPDYRTRAKIDAQPSQIKTRSRSVSVSSLNLNSHFALFVEPTTVTEALKSAESQSWKSAMENEMQSLTENETWTLVPLPEDRKAIKCKWVFKVKRDANGKISKYKARLVAKGFSQRPGIDFEETFAPVVRYDSIRYLLALSVTNGYTIDQMDAITAFLQGDLPESVYMEQAEHFSDGTNRVCKLNKAIYGLKQAGRQWNIKLDAALKKHGLKKSVADPCIYYASDLNIIIAIYVDDILIFHRNQNDLIRIKKFLHSNFKMKDLGKAKSCLGMRIDQHRDGIYLDQITYVNDILSRFGMADCKPVGTPSDINSKLSVTTINDNNDLTGKVPYREAIGSLIHLANCTRPDISFAVNDASRFNARHSNEHWQAVKRIFRYLRGTIEYRLQYTKGGSGKVHAFCDSDFASEPDKRRSCSAHVIKKANAAITWHSHRQEIVALSSTEAEYISLSDCVKQVLWHRKLINELENDQYKITIYMDNESSIKLSKTDAYSARSKHIDVRYHHTRHQIEMQTIAVQYCNTAENTADALTKPVTKEKTLFCNDQMGLRH